MNIKLFILISITITLGLSSLSLAQGRKLALLVGVDKYPSSGNFRSLDYLRPTSKSFKRPHWQWL
ncbi:MAG: hypothetical protein R3C03_17800 [Pirellulaceae bacterium]